MSYLEENQVIGGNEKLYDTDFKSYFAVLWIILIDDYAELCLSEYSNLDDSEISQYYTDYKSKCRAEYMSLEK